jgi:hypothetical protein
VSHAFGGFILQVTLMALIISFCLRVVRVLGLIASFSGKNHPMIRHSLLVIRENLVRKPTGIFTFEAWLYHFMACALIIILMPQAFLTENLHLVRISLATFLVAVTATLFLRWRIAKIQ